MFALEGVSFQEQIASMLEGPPLHSSMTPQEEVNLEGERMQEKFVLMGEEHPRERKRGVQASLLEAYQVGMAERLMVAHRAVVAGIQAVVRTQAGESWRERTSDRTRIQLKIENIPGRETRHT